MYCGRRPGLPHKEDGRWEHNLGVSGVLMQQHSSLRLRLGRGRRAAATRAETGLLQLQEIKRQQETAARTRQFLQEHPELVLGQGGGSSPSAPSRPAPWLALLALAP